MPDLGKYADAVLSAYAVSLLLMAGIVLVSLWRARAVKRELETAEAEARVDPTTSAPTARP
jgi:heme exporter protein D